MLPVLALTAFLLQDPAAPPPPAPPEIGARVMVMGPDGPGGLDKDGDGQVTRDEFSAPITDAFGRLDKDGDGRLSAEELASGHGSGGPRVLSMHGPGGPRRIEFRGPGGDDDGEIRIFARRDGGRDEDREVTIRAVGRDGGPHVVRRMGDDGENTEVFVIAGRDGDEDHEVVVRGLPREGGPRIRLSDHGHGGARVEVRRVDGPGGSQDLDKDGDGKVSEAEFTAPLRDAFTRMDADRSGFIEDGERSGDNQIHVFAHTIETRRDGED